MTYRSATKRTATLVEFRYGSQSAPSFSRFTDDAEDLVTTTGSAWLSVPEMGVRLAERTGGFGERPSEIALPRDADAFVERIREGRPHSPVSVKVWERIDGGRYNPAQLVQQFSGTLSRTVRGHENNKGIVLFEALPWKELLDFSLGLPTNPDCGNTFGGQGCFLDLGPLMIHNLVGSNLNGATIELDDGGGPTGPLKGAIGAGGGLRALWDDGTLERDGLILKIREWAGPGSGLFTLVEPPPLEWDGATDLTITPGCDLRYLTCHLRWNRLEHFNGLGLGQPDHNPIFETPE
jgi:hypothetical protein